jgi:hypothetical protein
MAKRLQLGLVLAGILGSMGASYRTPEGNFVVEAPTPQIAMRLGQWAEYYRKEKANLWLGREMPRWNEPCPLRITVTAGGAGGATSFSFMQGQILQTMHIEGPLDRLVASVLPHEITHTVFAYYFGCPVPRWADEGSAVLSEDELEKSRHDMLVRQIINSGRMIHLGQLFGLRDYPREVGALYAEGYSVSSFLVSIGPGGAGSTSSRQQFLQFVAHGMQPQYGWDRAAQAYYRFPSVNQLESAWYDFLRRPRNQPPPDELAANNPERTGPFDPASRVVVRLTAPPMQPLPDDPAPVIRGQMPDLGGWSDTPRRQLTSRPGYLPDYSAHPSPAPTNLASQGQDRWQPRVQLLAPVYETPAAAGAGTSASPSPVGYPN